MAQALGYFAYAGPLTETVQLGNVAIHFPGTTLNWDAENLRIAEQYLMEFGKLAKESNTMIMPSNLADISSIIATATKVFDATKES